MKKISIFMVSMFVFHCHAGTSNSRDSVERKTDVSGQSEDERKKTAMSVQKYPIERGLVAEWDDMEKIWHCGSELNEYLPRKQRNEKKSQKHSLIKLIGVCHIAIALLEEKKLISPSSDPQIMNPYLNEEKEALAALHAQKNLIRRANVLCSQKNVARQSKALLQKKEKRNFSKSNAHHQNQPSKR